MRLDDDLSVIPTPGHTRGHAVLLHRDQYLFTGDHLAWSRRRGHLVAFRDANWYSWPETIRSMERLLDYAFEWVLPGHGERFHAASPAAMRRRARALRRLDEAALAARRRQAPDGRRDAADSQARGSRRATSSSRPPGSRASASRTRRRLLGRRRGSRRSLRRRRRRPFRPRLPPPARRRSRPRCRARTRPARAAGAPPTRAASAAPIARKSPASTASAISRRRVADLVEARRDEMVALEAGAEDLPVVHPRGVRGARCRRASGAGAMPRGRPRAGRPRRAPAGSAACAGRRRAAGSSPATPAGFPSTRVSTSRTNSTRPSPSNGAVDARGESRGHRHRQRRRPPETRAERDVGRKLDLARLVDLERLQQRPGERRPRIRQELDRARPPYRS